MNRFSLLTNSSGSFSLVWKVFTLVGLLWLLFSWSGCEWGPGFVSMSFDMVMSLAEWLYTLLETFVFSWVVERCSSCLKILGSGFLRSCKQSLFTLVVFFFLFVFLVLLLNLGLKIVAWLILLTIFLPESLDNRDTFRVESMVWRFMGVLISFLFTILTVFCLFSIFLCLAILEDFFGRCTRWWIGPKN